jgi:hypothetical protein
MTVLNYDLDVCPTDLPFNETDKENNILWQIFYDQAISVLFYQESRSTTISVTVLYQFFLSAKPLATSFRLS